MEALVNYTQQPYLQGSMVKEYLLVVNPEITTWQRVMEEKQQFFLEFGAKTARKAKPHITVANFLAKEEMEETLLRWMHRIISSQTTFTVALNNYGGFPNANAVYLRVQDHQPFKMLAKQLKVIEELVRANELPRPYFVSNPHMTIARKLEKEVYEQAMLSYSQKDFHAEFEVKELVLLKRDHQFDACKQVTIFRLMP